MENGSILIVAGTGSDPAALEDIVETVRTRNLRMSILIAALATEAPIYTYGLEFYGAFPTVADWQDDGDATRSRLDETAARFRRRLDAEGVSGDVATLLAPTLDLERVVARMALTRDIVITTKGMDRESSLFRSALHAGLFYAPAGILIDAPGGRRPLDPKRVFVAWNDGLPAGRALRAALPLLGAAQEVTIGLFDADATDARHGANPGSDVARWLSHRGCRVNVQQYASGGIEIGEAVLLRAREAQADLVVMGAYQHSRMREMILGGTTRTVIERSVIPVLLAH